MLRDYFGGGVPREQEVSLELEVWSLE
jgi:hypothetical protein